MKFILSIMCMSSFLILTSCLGGGSSDGGGNSGVVATIICSGAEDCADETAKDGVAVVAFLKDTACDELTGDPSYKNEAEITCTAGTCTAGPILTWKDSDGNDATIAEGTYAAVAFLDTDNSGDPSLGEPLECTVATWGALGTLSLEFTNFEDVQN